MNIVPHYINLDSRGDRKTYLENEFNKMGIDTYIRIPAIYNKDGLFGCLQSHIKTLENYNIDSDVLWVCEDDIEFLLDKPYLDKCIDEFLKSDGDILCLGFNSKIHKKYSSNLLRTTDNQTASSYIIKKSFRNILLEFWKSIYDCIENKKKHPLEDEYNKLQVHRGPFYVNDQSWKLLQQKYIFLIPEKRILHQRPGYSDIVKRNVNYKC